MRLDDLYLVDIIEAYSSIVRMIAGTTADEFLADERLSPAVQMRLVIMGEALSAMKPETREALVDVPVDQIRGLRNRIVHGYFTVDDRLIHRIATENAPGLAAWVSSVVQQRSQLPERGPIAQSADLDDSCGAMIVVGTIQPVPRPQDGLVIDPLLYINGAIEQALMPVSGLADRRSRLHGPSP
jgi:uncharacterized protein with HEPN domain